MGKVLFSHICDYASVGDQKLNVLGIFDIIHVDSEAVFPVVHPQLYFVAKLKFESVGEHPVNIKLKNLEKDTYLDGSFEKTVKIDNVESAHNLIIQVPFLSFENTGDYQFEVWLGSDSLAKTSKLRLEAR